MSTLADRLKSAMADAGLRQLDLARLCGVRPPSVNDWLSGKTRALRGVSLIKAAAALGVSEQWLAEGRGPKSREEARLAPPQPSRPWPFMLIDPERYDRLSDYAKGFIEGHVKSLLEELELTEKLAGPEQDDEKK